MNQTKKCFHCEHMMFCTIYRQMADMAELLNMHLSENPIGETPFEYIINEVGHNCTRFEKIKIKRHTMD